MARLACHGQHVAPASLSPENLRLARKAAGLSQEHAAYRAGCSLRTLQRTEAAKTIPHFDLVVRLAELYGVTIDELMHVPNGSPTAPARGKSRGEGTASHGNAPAAKRKRV